MVLIVTMETMKWTKRRKNKNASVPEDVTAVSGSMWFAGVTITVGIGAAAFILSFLALRDLCIQAGQPREIAFLFPVIVDGTILQATMESSPDVTTTGHDDSSGRFSSAPPPSRSQETRSTPFSPRPPASTPFSPP